MLKIARKTLLELLEPAARVAPNRSSKEVLRWVRLTHDGKLLSVQAWDGEVGIKLRREHSGDACDFMLPPWIAVPWLKGLSAPNEDVDVVTLDAKKDGVHALHGRSKFRFPAYGLDDFPEWESKGEPFTLTAAVFNPAVQRVRCAVAEGSDRYAFCGVCLDMPNGYVVATDSRVLCCEPIGATGELMGVLPLKLANTACNALVGDFAVRMTAGTIEMDDRHTCVFGRLVQGRFPHWKLITESAKPETEIDVSVGELLRVTKQAMLASDAERRSVDISIAQGTLSACSSSSDRGESQVQMPVASDAAVGVTFDGALLANMLSCLDPLEPVHWQVSRNHANKFTLREWTGVVMPMAERQSDA